LILNENDEDAMEMKGRKLKEEEEKNVEVSY